LHIYF